jgi:hypothetical protein
VKNLAFGPRNGVKSDLGLLETLQISAVVVDAVTRRIFDKSTAVTDKA